MPLGINNPLVRRVKSHASMSVLFRAIEPRHEQPLSRRQLQYVPPMVSPSVIPSEGEVALSPEGLSPLDQAIQSAEKPTPVAPTPVAPTPVGPTPTVQKQPEQPPVEQPASLPQSQEDQDWGGSWGR